MAAPDLYAELGIARGASTGEVSRAYRKRAQETHPDKGGTPEQFRRTRSAYMVLADPKRREQYDHTGTIDEPQADNALSEQLVVVHQLLDAALIRCAQRGADPATVALIAEMKGLSSEAERKLKETRGQVQTHLAMSQKLVGRFSAKEGEPNRMAAMVESRIAAQHATIAKLNHDIAVLQEVRMLLDGYSYRADAPKPYGTLPTSETGRPSIGFFSFG